MVAHNPYWNFIASHPEVDWDWEIVTQNPNITSEIVANNLSYPWDFEYVSSNLMDNITAQMIIDNPDKEWNFHVLSIWPGITIDLVIKLKDKDWRPLMLYINPAISITDIIAHAYLFPYFIPSISTRKDLTIETIFKYPDFEWCWNPISCHINTTFDIVKKYPELPWNYLVMSANKNITWEIIMENQDIPWAMNIISANPNITVDIVLNNPNLDWDFEILSGNESIPLADIKKSIDIIEWEFDVISYRTNLDWEIVEELIDEDWNFYVLSENNMLPWDLVRKTMNKEWDFNILSDRDDIAWDLVIAYPHRLWNYPILSKNPTVTLEAINSTYFKTWNANELFNNVEIRNGNLHKEIKMRFSVFEELGSNLKFDGIKTLIDAGILRPEHIEILKLAALKNPLITPRIIEANKDYFAGDISAFAHNTLGKFAYFQSEYYRKHEIKNRIKHLYNELIARACRTSRLFEWNEDAKNIFPEYYVEYCAKKYNQ